MEPVFVHSFDEFGLVNIFIIPSPSSQISVALLNRMSVFWRMKSAKTLLNTAAALYTDLYKTFILHSRNVTFIE